MSSKANGHFSADYIERSATRFKIAWCIVANEGLADEFDGRAYAGWYAAWCDAGRPLPAAPWLRQRLTEGGPA